MVNARDIKEHMEVKASDGQHVGKVDHIEGTDKIKLTKHDPANDGPHHHFIPLAWVDHVDTHVHLSKTSDDVKAHWEHGAN